MDTPGIKKYKELYDEALKIAGSKGCTRGDEKAVYKRARKAWEELDVVESLYVWSPGWLWMQMGRVYVPITCKIEVGRT